MLTTLDFTDTADADSLISASVPRKSKWNALLSSLYDATAAGQVGRDAKGGLKFTKIGQYANLNGARMQAKAFAKVPATNGAYEFKHVTKVDDGGATGSVLYARVREVTAE